MNSAAPTAFKITHHGRHYTLLQNSVHTYVKVQYRRTFLFVLQYGPMFQGYPSVLDAPSILVSCPELCWPLCVHTLSCNINYEKHCTVSPWLTWAVSESDCNWPNASNHPSYPHISFLPTSIHFNHLNDHENGGCTFLQNVSILNHYMLQKTKSFECSLLLRLLSVK